MSVKFLRHYRLYFTGDIATFKPDEEAGLIARGTAVPIILPPAADGHEPEPLPNPSTRPERT